MKISNVAAIVAMAALSVAASAQGRPPQGGPGGGMGRGGGMMMGGGRRSPQEQAEMQTRMMTQMLSLTPAQAAKVKAIALKAAMDMKKVRDAQAAALKKVLTPDQVKKMESMRGPGGGRGMGGPGGRPPGR